MKAFRNLPLAHLVDGKAPVSEEIGRPSDVDHTPAHVRASLSSFAQVLILHGGLPGWVLSESSCSHCHFEVRFLIDVLGRFWELGLGADQHATRTKNSPKCFLLLIVRPRSGPDPRIWMPGQTCWPWHFPSRQQKSLDLSRCRGTTPRMRSR